ncbi:hypothetical protein PQQ75_04220 [Paraburkholderia aspalathi]|uniref:hypothetical protein n=1 Tax=Paraburkholderia aspalathi TaxID=1324617 RepID=UPI0038B8C695
MSADSHTGRSPYTNSGSDTKKHYDRGNIVDLFNRSSAGGAKPTQNDPHVLDTPKVPKDNGSIKDQ